MESSKWPFDGQDCNLIVYCQWTCWLTIKHFCQSEWLTVQLGLSWLLFLTSHFDKHFLILLQSMPWPSFCFWVLIKISNCFDCYFVYLFKLWFILFMKLYFVGKMGLLVLLTVGLWVTLNGKTPTHFTQTNQA